MTSMLNSAETAAVTNDPMHVESIKDTSEASMDDEYLFYDVDVKPGMRVIFVTQDLTYTGDVSSPSPHRLHIK